MINRRKFVKAVALGVGVASVSAVPPMIEPSWRFLTNDEARLLEALCEQIIPGDETPGATDAGVVRFIDRQLALRYERYQKTYRQGLEGVEQTSQDLFGKSFKELNNTSQIVVLKELEAGKAKGAIWEKEASRAFFNLLRDHCMQGFYGSPRHGGNRGYASYKMLELDYPQIIGQNRYPHK